MTPTGTLTPPAPLATILAVSSPVFTDVQVTNGRSYFYELGIFDSSAGLGPLASAAALPFSAPAAVQPVTVSNLRSNALDLSWGIPLSSYPVSYYQVYRYAILTPTPLVAPTFTFTPSPTVTGTVTPVPTPTFTPATPLPTALIPASVLLSLTPIATVTGTSFTDNTAGSLLTDGIYYLVVAVDGETPPVMGLAPANATKAAIPKNLGPFPPSLSSLVSAAATPVIGTTGYGIRLFWNGPSASEGVTAYQVFSGSSALTQIAVATPSPTYVFDDSSIPFSSSASVTTSYKVVALNSNGSTSSNVLEGNVLKSSVPNLIQVTPNATTDGIEGVTVVWNNGTAGSYGLSGYRVYKSSVGVPNLTGSVTPTIVATVFATVVITPSISPTLSAVDSGVTNAHGWSYWVEPYDQLLLGGTIGVAATPALNLAPTPVGTVTAVAVPGTNNQINVAWSQVGPGFYGPVQNYAIYREYASALTQTPVATVPASQTSFIDHAVGTPGAPGTPVDSVIYQVAALDSKGNSSPLSGYSNGVVLSSQTAPEAPRVLNPSSDASTVFFYWRTNPTPDAVDHYYIYGADFAQVTPTVTPLAVVPPNPSGITAYSMPGTLWNASNIYVQAHNALPAYGPSSLLSCVPVANFQVTAVVTPASTREIHVSWDMAPVPGTTPPVVDSFEVYRASGPNATFTPVANLALGSSTYIDSSITAGQTYYYRITARANGGGASSESAIYPTMSVTPEASSSTWPNAPAGVTAVSSGVSQTTISWLGNAAQENVERDVLYQNGVVLATVTPGTTNEVVVNEVPGTVSAYQVAAENTPGLSDLSLSVSVLVQPKVTPVIGVSPPAGYVPTPGVTPVRLVWISGLDSAAPVDGYTIYRSTVSGTTGFSPIGSVTSPVSFFSDSPSAAANVGVTNYYKAAAKGLGLQADQNFCGALAVEGWPNIPVLSMTSSATAVTLLWATPTGNVSVTNYTVYKNLYPNLTPTAVATVLPPSGSYSDPTVTPGVIYNYWLDAQNASGTSDLPTPEAIIPLQPPSLSITPLAGRNTLAWSPVTITPSNSVTGYAVFRAFATPGATPAFTQVSGILRGLSTPTFTDSQVLDAVSYVYVVAAASAGGQYGAFSNPVSVTVLPQPVLSLTAVSGDGLVQLRWAYQGTPGNNFIIQRKLGTEADSSYQTLKSGVVGVNYLDTGVLDKTFYAYRVITVDSLGLTAVSPAAIALPAAPPLVMNPMVSISQGEGGNSLSWWPANTTAAGPVSLYDLLNTTTMYPLGGYSVYRSVDGGAVYQPLAAIVPAAAAGTAPAGVTFADGVSLVGGPSYTYLVQAFDAPPDIPGFISQGQAVTQGLVHATSYLTSIAYSLNASTALDRNAVRPFGAANEQNVNIRFVVTQQGKVNIKVYSLNGTFVRELVNRDFVPGVYGLPNSTYPLSWDARNMNGALVASGVYLISTEMAGGHQEFQKVAVIK